MAGPNLEVFKFGLYIMFPIAWMYYFGTNLENRFSVPDFWPKPEATYKIPFERSEIQDEIRRLRERRLEKRAARVAGESEALAENGVKSPDPNLSTRVENGGRSWWSRISGGNGNATRQE